MVAAAAAGGATTPPFPPNSPTAPSVGGSSGGGGRLVPATNAADTAVPPGRDAATAAHLRRSLAASVAACAPLPRDGRPHTSAPALLPPGGGGAPPGAVLGGGACEVVPGHDLARVATVGGVAVYATRSLPGAAEWVVAETVGAAASAAGGGHPPVAGAPATRRFVALLTALSGGVYGLDPAAVAAYYDPSARTVAFNAGRSLYFNVRFWATLHDAAAIGGGGGGGEAGGGGMLEAAVYWYVVMAHELAHNFGSAHDATHGHYVESYVQAYLPALMTAMGAGQFGGGGGGAAG